MSRHESIKNKHPNGYGAPRSVHQRFYFVYAPNVVKLIRGLREAFIILFRLIDAVLHNTTHLERFVARSLVFQPPSGKIKGNEIVSVFLFIDHHFNRM